mmetsp:Transcript_59233/g.139511  ORF Transcript_59233/g.139511 Transcript_59233/m.139511 type:complete len:215 (+) Transcript_59233:1445-2089(+)
MPCDVVKLPGGLRRGPQREPAAREPGQTGLRLDLLQRARQLPPRRRTRRRPPGQPAVCEDGLAVVHAALFARGRRAVSGRGQPLGVGEQPVRGPARRPHLRGDQRRALRPVHDGRADGEAVVCAGRVQPHLLDVRVRRGDREPAAALRDVDGGERAAPGHDRDRVPVVRDVRRGPLREGLCDAPRRHRVGRADHRQDRNRERVQCQGGDRDCGH